MRIKRGLSKKQKHKSVLKQAKGYRMTYSKLYRRAKQILLHSGEYSYAHRKARRSQLKTDWIKAIAAGLAGSGVSYSQFKNGLKQNNIIIDSKNLAEMAVNNPAHFKSIVETVSAK